MQLLEKQGILAPIFLSYFHKIVRKMETAISSPMHIHKRSLNIQNEPDFQNVITFQVNITIKKKYPVGKREQNPVNIFYSQKN